MQTRFVYDVADASRSHAASPSPALEWLGAVLGRAGGRRGDTGSAPADLPLVQVVLTGGTEGALLERLAWRAGRVGPQPVLLVAHPQHNSLPAALELLARVRRDGGSGRILALAGPGDAAGAAELETAVRLATVTLDLRRSRLGAVGEAAEWLVAGTYPAGLVRSVWGPEVVAVPLAELEDRLAAAAPDPELAASLAGSAAPAGDPADPELGRALGVHRALRQLVEERRLDALTLSCFGLLERQGTTGCLALACLGDEGLPAGCEGDVPSALALLWVRLLTGHPGWMANPAWVDPAGGRLLLAHCTVPRTLVEGYRLRTHFESDLGLALEGRLPAGPVTLVRLGGPDLRRLWLAEGELLPTAPREGLCRTQAEVRADPAALRRLLEEPLGNHLVLVPGRLAGDLAASHRLVVGTPA